MEKALLVRMLMGPDTSFGPYTWTTCERIWREGRFLRLEELIPNPRAKNIFAMIRRYGTVSKAELVQESGMTVSTLTRALDELCTRRLIEEVGYGESTGGRRPVLYRINPDYGRILGLDISRTAVKLLLCDMQLNPLADRTWAMDETMTPLKLVRTVTDAVDQIKRSPEATGHPILGMGIGAVGPLDRVRGVIEKPRYFPAQGWENVNICELFEEKLGLPVLLDNGVNNALLGEYWAHGADEHNHQLYVHVGVGLRSAMMSDRKLVYGAVDMEGALGQMVIETDGRPAREPGGNYGALESYATTDALERQARAALKLGRQSIMTEMCEDLEQLRFRTIVQALNKGDELARELILQAASYFGTGLANLLNILHPEKVILGGPLIVSNDLFFTTATEIAKQKTYYYPKYQVEFTKSKLGSDAVCIGSAVLVLDRMGNT